MKKIRLKMAKPLYFRMSILDISKILMYEFWCDYIKPKYGDRAKLCYMDTDSFAIYIKTKDFFEDSSNDVERWFDTSTYDKNDKRPLPIGKNKKVPGLFKAKDELGGKIMAEVVALRPETYAYLIDDGSGHKKAKGTKKCVIKQKLMYILKITKIACLITKLYIDHKKEEVNNIALSSYDDKRLQTFDRIASYLYGTDEMMIKQS